MNCPKCGKPVQPGASFCMQCGQWVGSVPAAGPAGQPGAVSQAFIPQNTRTKTTVMAVAIAILLLAVLGLALQAAGVLRLGSSVAPANLKATGQMPNSTLMVPGKRQSAPLASAATRPAEMPQDIYDWLEHLRRIEARKNELHLRQIADLKVFQEMLSTLGPGIGETDVYDQSESTSTPPADVTKGKFQDLRPDWNQLIVDFKAKPPPEECVPIANDYNRALAGIPAMTTDLIEVLNMVSSNPQAALVAATKMKSKSYGEIDRYLISTNDRVEAICEKYNKHKWFNIRTDVGGSDALGKMGF